MTADARFERDLTAVLEDLYLGPSPEYRREVIAVATHRRQRPAWTFAGRWLPMADIASRPAIATPVPWRAVGLALLVIALLLAAVVAFVGSNRTRPAPAFGLAANGRIAYVSNGDLLTVDPLSGETTALVTSLASEDQPAFSPDGTRLAFRRSNATVGSPAEDIVVANPDGSNPIVITSEPIVGGTYGMEWAPDSRSLVVGAAMAGEIRLYDATRAAAPRVLTTNAWFGTAPFRPPDGGAILLAHEKNIGGANITEWYVHDLATGTETDVAPHFGDGGYARWSPDGSQVVLTQAEPGHSDTPVLIVVNADGSDPHRVTNEPGITAEFDPAWSPDGARIAFNRAARDDSSPFSARPTGILTLATGAIDEVGPLASDVRSSSPGPLDALADDVEAYSFDWSPDGRWLFAMAQDTVAHPVLIDTTTGDFRVLDVLVAPGSARQQWQRTAP